MHLGKAPNSNFSCLVEVLVVERDSAIKSAADMKTKVLTWSRVTDKSFSMTVA